MNRFSPTLALTGVAALLVAAWGLLGSPDITNSSAALWSALGIAVVVGLVLIFSGSRHHDDDQGSDEQMAGNKGEPFE